MAPTLTWPGRGRSVVRDAATGRWRFAAEGERAADPARLVPEAAHGAAGDPPNLLVHGEAPGGFTLMRVEGGAPPGVK